MENVFETNHPLIQHKISILRNKNTGTNEFREIVDEIGMLMGYEALSDLPTHLVEVDTPIATCLSPMIEGRKLAIVPILRAGLGMMNGVLKLVPSAKVATIGSVTTINLSSIWEGNNNFITRINIIITIQIPHLVHTKFSPIRRF